MAIELVRDRGGGWRRAGAGDLGFSDILASSSDARAAWSQVESQLLAEGTAGLLTSHETENAITAAKSNFQSSYNQLVGVQVDATQAVGSAGQFALQAQSVLGAATNIAGFISSAESNSVPPQSLVQSFTGIIVGIAIAAGASAGVGAAIIGGVALGVAALSAAGFFPSQPSGVDLCDGSVKVPASNDGHVITVGCVAGSYGSPGQARIPGPQDPRWRSFPSDPLWFELVNSGGSTLVQPISWGDGKWGSGDIGPRMIDAAFAQFRHLECEQSHFGDFGLPGPAQDFCRGYFSAWKMNAALRFNGQTAASDVEVLKHYTVQWNRAHEGGSTYMFQSRGNDTAFMNNVGPHDCGDVVNYGPYLSYLIRDIGGTLSINTGALKKPPNVATLTNNVKAGSAASSTATTAAKLGVLVGAGTLLAVGAYALHEKIGYLEAWNRLYSRAAKAIGRR